MSAFQCEEGSVFNPLTGQCVRIGGKAHFRMLRAQGLKEPAIPRRRSPGASTYRPPSTRGRSPPVRAKKAKVTSSSKTPVYECQEGYVFNPLTGQCVKIGGKAHFRMLRAQGLKEPAIPRRRRSPS